jgi:hypothetical protein
LNSQELQRRFTAALSRVTEDSMTSTAKRQQPIFNREPAMTEKQSLEDAANALAALWKTAKR